MPMITTPTPEKENRKTEIQKKDLVKAKRVTQLSDCSMSQSSKKIRELNNKVMKYISNQ
nr:hypothetical protein [Lysinibacillus timonensis]